MLLLCITSIMARTDSSAVICPPSISQAISMLLMSLLYVIWHIYAYGQPENTYVNTSPGCRANITVSLFLRFSSSAMCFSYISLNSTTYRMKENIRHTRRAWFRAAFDAEYAANLTQSAFYTYSLRGSTPTHLQKQGIASLNPSRLTWKRPCQWQRCWVVAISGLQWWAQWYLCVNGLRSDQMS